MGVQVAPPGGDIAMQVGDAIDDRHQDGSKLCQIRDYEVSAARVTSRDL
jgi:hypothetical protein